MGSTIAQFKCISTLETELAATTFYAWRMHDLISCPQYRAKGTKLSKIASIFATGSERDYGQP